MSMALARALVRATPTASEQAVVSKPAGADLITVPMKANVASKKPEYLDGWIDGAMGTMPHERALLEHFVQVCLDVNTAGNDLERCLIKLPQHFSPDHLLSVMGTEPLSKSCLTACRRWLSESEVAESSRGFKALLQGPGVSLSTLADSCFGKTLKGASRLLVAQVLARILGAREVSFGKEVDRDFWTVNPELVTLIINTAKGRRELKFADALKELCPALDPNLQAWMYKVVTPLKGKKSPRKVVRR
jgi:hypothetical protein